MFTLLDLHHRNPSRPPDWRWLRAVGVADEGHQRPTHRRDGENNVVLIRKAINFKHAHARAALDTADSELYLRLIDRYPDLVWAHSFYADSNKLQSRYLIEARLLAQQSNREIAFSVGSEESVIDIYEKVFFSVRDRLRYPDYIFQVVIGKGLHGALSSNDYGLLWKLFAYLGGPHVLDSLVRRVSNPSWVNRPEEVLSFFHDVAIGTMKQRAAVAAAAVQVNGYTSLPILESFVKYVEVERSTEGGQSESQLLGNIAGVLTGMQLSVATQPNIIAQQGYGAFDLGAVELRGDEMLMLATGQELPDKNMLLELKHPVVSH